ncbi:MAG: hypothetical protein AMXMBFR82_53460 [Candidatus Hydrogenedentota bacterium]
MDDMDLMDGMDKFTTSTQPTKTSKFFRLNIIQIAGRPALPCATSVEVPIARFDLRRRIMPSSDPNTKEG